MVGPAGSGSRGSKGASGEESAGGEDGGLHGDELGRKEQGVSDDQGETGRMCSEQAGGYGRDQQI